MDCWGLETEKDKQAVLRKGCISTFCSVPPSFFFGNSEQNCHFRLLPTHHQSSSLSPRQRCLTPLAPFSFPPSRFPPPFFAVYMRERERAIRICLGKGRGLGEEEGDVRSSSSSSSRGDCGRGNASGRAALRCEPPEAQTRGSFAGCRDAWCKSKDNRSLQQFYLEATVFKRTAAQRDFFPNL